MESFYKYVEKLLKIRKEGISQTMNSAEKLSLTSVFYALNSSQHYADFNVCECDVDNIGTEQMLRYPAKAPYRFCRWGALFLRLPETMDVENLCILESKKDALDDFCDEMFIKKYSPPRTPRSSL